MQTLRKKNSPYKFKREPTRFLGEGVTYKAKLIGILEVSEASGDRICQAALADLKMAIRAAGEHKQRIAVQVNVDGVRLKEEKTGECLYHHPVYKISYISQDMTDPRAFGYIFGTPSIGHRFFGIKTDKIATQAVIAIRDLFQVFLNLQYKEIELAKQHIEQNSVNAIKFHTSGIFVEPSPDTKGAAGTESSLQRLRSTTSEVEKPVERKNESQRGIIADLLDLQFELNSLQQGIHEMDKNTPENTAASADDLFESDPFGDSFANMKLTETVRPILPPPPSSSKRGHLDRQQTVTASQTSSTASPATTAAGKTPPPESAIHWFDKETENLFSDDELENASKNTTETKETEDAIATLSRPKSPQIDVFTELDPLGTGLIKPYIDKKDFFQHLKNPPKKVLKDLVSTSSTDTFPTNFNIISDPLESVKVSGESPSKTGDPVEEMNFANFDRFDENEASQSALPLPVSPPKKDLPTATHHQPLSVSLPPEEPTTSKSSIAPPASVLTRTEKDSTESVHGMLKLPSPKKYLQSVRKKEFDVDLSAGRAPSIDKPFPVDFSATSDSPASPLRSCSSDANSRLSSSSAELELVPEPPPRGVGSVLLNPPPLPPKKQSVRSGMKPPLRLTHPESYFHYDFPEHEPVSASPIRTKEKLKSPPREIKGQFDDDFSPSLHLSGRSDLIGTMTTSAFEQSFSSMIPTTNLSSFFTATSTPASTKRTKPSLDITLSQLTSSNLDELANSLGMTVQRLTSLTLQQLTECLATLSMKEASISNDTPEVASAKPEKPPDEESQPSAKVAEQTSFVSSQPLFKTDFDQELKQDATYDKYAVFREFFQMEQMEQMEQREQSEETDLEDTNEENLASKEGEPQEEQETQLEVQKTDTSADSLASLVNLTVKLPPSNEELIAKEDAVNNEEVEETFSTLMTEKDQQLEAEEKEEEAASDSSAKQAADEDFEKAAEIDDRATLSDRGSDPNGKILAEGNVEEANGSFSLDKAEVKSSTSTSSDKYAALREIISEPEAPSRKSEEESTTPPRTSSAMQPQSKSLAEVELLNLFSVALPVPSSPKKKEEALKAVAMNIFEEIKMLNTGVQSAKDSKAQMSGFEDVFCPFGTETKQDEIKDDGNWGKFDAGVFGSDRSSCEGPRSVGGTSPWSPDGKEFHREASYKSSVQRHSGDSDNEWKDEEESEDSNGRVRGDGRFWYGRHPRFEAGAFEDRNFYEEAPGDKRDRSFRDRMGRKSRGAPWSKATGHRPRDPSPWHEECQWEEEPRRYPHCKMPYKDDEEQYEGHWKCRPKPQGRWNWGHEHGSFYDDERKRKLMLWNEEDRFGSQESMGYDEDDRWSRRKYERRRWEEDARFWGRRTGPPESEYPMRETYYYYRESRERPHDYPTAWDEEYAVERPADDSPRYNPSGRKRHWPKRPNSANEGRNADMVYPEPRGKFGASRSECSDIDSDPYLRPSQRSRSRESYWGSDQEFDSWAERPYWSEGPEAKSESLHRRRIARRKSRPAQTKTQSPFEDDFGPSVEQVESPIAEALPSVEPRMRAEAEQKPAPSSPSARSSKEQNRRESPREYAGKRSSYFEDDLTPTASASSDASDRQRLPSDLKATPEELPCDAKDRSSDGFAAEDGTRDAFFNGDLRYEDKAFAFKSEAEDSVPDHRATTLPLKNSRQTKYPGNNNSNSKARGDQYIRKSESVNIFVRKNDPFDDDDFFN